jgi:6,7-dimethyl-8-ribityllumazine synthase
MKKTKGKSRIPKNVDHLKIGIITSRFNPEITQILEEEVVKTLKGHTIAQRQLHIESVPGALELPMATQHMILTKKVHVVICLGAVIKGDTPHFDYVCQETTRGLMDLSLATKTPIIMGVLTTNTIAQAEERSNPKKQNKGKEFAEAALEMSAFIMTKS